MNWIDLRSDTVTHPTPAMREAMAYAPVGDDVFGDDPTVNELQALAAEMFGKEAGLFVASGTMGNLTSILAHCGRGDELIVGKQAHIFRYEAGGAAAYGGVQPNTLEVQRDGTMALDAIREAIRPDDAHAPRTRLICLENTHGGASGAPVEKAYIDAVGEIAREHGLSLHIDGARIFNAATALKMPVNQLTEAADSVSICLSKGLCAPVGSVIVGSKAFIGRAHRIRKSLGGGMRQVGILAAAGKIALTEMSMRLAEDHLHARLLAEGIVELPYVQIDLSMVRTNIFYFNLSDDAPMTVQTLSERLRDEFGILMRPYNVAERSFRIVTHYWIERAHVDRILEAMRQLLPLPTAEPIG